MLTLYHGRTSVCSVKSRLALAEKGVDFDSKLMTLLDQTSTVWDQTVSYDPNDSNSPQQFTIGKDFRLSTVVTSTADSAVSFGIQVDSASALSADDIWVGGSPSGTTAPSVIIEHWNGHAWRKTPCPACVSARAPGPLWMSPP